MSTVGGFRPASAASNWRTPLVVIVCGCAIAMLGFGPRSSVGFFIRPMGEEYAWGRDVFGLALAVQNLLWGLGQPLAGAIADRFGLTRVMIIGALLYAGGLLLMRYATTPLSLNLGAGVLVGHTHFDHAVDAPALARMHQTKAYGSASLVRLMALHGLQEQAVEVATHRAYELGPFAVLDDGWFGQVHGREGSGDSLSRWLRRHERRCHDRHWTQFHWIDPAVLEAGCGAANIGLGLSPDGPTYCPGQRRGEPHPTHIPLIDIFKQGLRALALEQRRER